MLLEKDTADSPKTGIASIRPWAAATFFGIETHTPVCVSLRIINKDVYFGRNGTNCFGESALRRPNRVHRASKFWTEQL